MARKAGNRQKMPCHSRVTRQRNTKVISNDKLSQKDLLVKILNLAGRYGKYALVALLAVAYVAACFQAWTVVRVAFVVMLPILLVLAVYITVGEALDD